MLSINFSDLSSLFKLTSFCNHDITDNQSSLKIISTTKATSSPDLVKAAFAYLMFIVVFHKNPIILDDDVTNHNEINQNVASLFKVINRNTRTRCEMKKPEQRHWRRSVLLLTLNILNTLFNAFLLLTLSR